MPMTASRTIAVKLRKKSCTGPGVKISNNGFRVYAHMRASCIRYTCVMHHKRLVTSVTRLWTAVGQVHEKEGENSNRKDKERALIYRRAPEREIAGTRERAQVIESGRARERERERRDDLLIQRVARLEQDGRHKVEEENSIKVFSRTR